MSLGKFIYSKGIEGIERLLEDNEIKILPITTKYLAEYIVLEKLHKDPFDRLIISTSIADKLTLVTKDSEIQRYRVSQVW